MHCRILANIRTRQSLQHNVHSSIDLTAVQCSFWFLEEKTQQFKDFFSFFYSRGWSLSQDLAVVGIELSDCCHVKPTKLLASGLLLAGWGMAPWKQTLKSASISFIWDEKFWIIVFFNHEGFNLQNTVLHDERCKTNFIRVDVEDQNCCQWEISTS